MYIYTDVSSMLRCIARLIVQTPKKHSWWIVEKRHTSTCCKAGWTAAERGWHYVHNEAQIEIVSHLLKLWSTPIMKKQEAVRCENCTRWIQQQKTITPLVQSLQATRSYPVSAFPVKLQWEGKNTTQKQLHTSQMLYRKQASLCLQFMVLPLESKFLEAFWLFCQMS